MPTSVIEAIFQKFIHLLFLLWIETIMEFGDRGDDLRRFLLHGAYPLPDHVQGALLVQLRCGDQFHELRPLLLSTLLESFTQCHQPVFQLLEIDGLRLVQIQFFADALDDLFCMMLRLPVARPMTTPSGFMKRGSASDDFLTPPG